MLRFEGCQLPCVPKFSIGHVEITEAIIDPTSQAPAGTPLEPLCKAMVKTGL